MKEKIMIGIGGVLGGTVIGWYLHKRHCKDLKNMKGAAKKAAEEVLKDEDK